MVLVVIIKSNSMVNPTQRCALCTALKVNEHLPQCYYELSLLRFNSHNNNLC